MSGLVSGLPLVLERASMSSLDMTLSGGSGGAGDVLINWRHPLLKRTAVLLRITPSQDRPLNVVLQPSRWCVKSII